MKTTIHNLCSPSSHQLQHQQDLSFSPWHFHLQGYHHCFWVLKETLHSWTANSSKKTFKHIWHAEKVHSWTILKIWKRQKKKIKLLILIGWESKAFKQKSSCSIILIVVAPLITFISWRWHSCNLFQSKVKTRISSKCQSQDRGEECPVWQDYSSTCMQSKVLW